MTGAEHYREAERLLKLPFETEMTVARAQVHATLALVAATITPTASSSPHADLFRLTVGLRGARE